MKEKYYMELWVLVLFPFVHMFPSVEKSLNWVTILN